jgi:F0F1-type ATP synthase gamma subunit
MDIDIREYIEKGIVIPLGRKGESGVMTLFYGYADYVEECGEGYLQILHQRAGDEAASPVVITTEDNKAKWVVSSSDTAFAGQGHLQVVYSADNIKKSMVGLTEVEPSLITVT